MDGGGLCVMTSGLPQTLVWLVVSLGFLLLVPPGPQAVLEGELLVLYRALGCHGQQYVSYIRDSDQMWVSLY